MALVTLEMIREAAEHLKGVAQRTSMMHSTSFSAPVLSNYAVHIIR